MESWGEKKCILKNGMCLTSKHFNWTSHYKNPDGPCSVQASGGLQHVTMCKMHHPLPPPGCTENFQPRYHRLAKSEFYSLLGIWGDFREHLRDLGLSSPLSCRLNPCNLKITHCLGWCKGAALQRKQSWPVWPSAGENQFHKHITSGSGPIYNPSGSHRGWANTCTLTLLVQTFAFKT